MDFVAHTWKFRLRAARILSSLREARESIQYMLPKTSLSSWFFQVVSAASTDGNWILSSSQMCFLSQIFYRELFARFFFIEVVYVVKDVNTTENVSQRDREKKEKKKLKKKSK